MKSAHRLRRHAVVLVTALAIPALASCGDNGQQGAQTGTAEDSTIVVQTLTSLEPQFKEYAASYMEAFPGRTVEVRSTTDDAPEYAQQLATARLSENLPDVFFNVDFLSDTLAENDVPLDLGPGMAEGKLGGLTVEDFLPQFVDQYRPLGKPETITGLPVSADSVGLFYNKSLFEEAGVDELPRADWTWEDMYRVAEEIQTSSDGQITGLAAPLADGNAQVVYAPVIKAYGGMVYDPATQTSGIGQPAAVEAWKMLISAYETTSGQYTATANDPSLTFTSGNVAMAISSRATVPQTKSALQVDWDVERMPTINGSSTAGGGSYGLSIAQSSSNQDAAWAFLSWFYDADAGQLVAQDVGNTIPPTAEGLKQGTWKDIDPPPANIEIFGESASTAVLLPQMPGSSASVLGEATKKATQQVVLEGRPVEEAFAEAEQTVNEAIAEES